MLINLTLLHISYSNLLPSPLISGSFYNTAIDHSYFSRSFSNFVYLFSIHQFNSTSTQYYHFLKEPISISNDLIIVGLSYTCDKNIKKLNIGSYEDLKSILFRLCIFNDCQNFMTEENVRLVDISKSIFQDGKGKCGISLENVNEVYISKTVFSDCHYDNNLISAPRVTNFTFVDDEIISCNSSHIIEIPGRIPFHKFNFINFIKLKDPIFTSSSITVCYSYFKDVQRIMDCTETPMGCLSPIKLISCSGSGLLPDGYSNQINAIDATKVNIDTYKPDDCYFISFASLAFSTPIPASTTLPLPSTAPPSSTEPPATMTPVETPLISASPTLSPDATPSESISASASPSPSESPLASPTVSPNATETPSLSQSPTASKSPTPTLSPTESPTVSQSPWPTFTPTQSPKATPNVPLIAGITVGSVIALIILIILLFLCIRKLIDVCQENFLDRGYILRYSSGENSDSTSNRNNALNLKSDSLSDSDDNMSEERFAYKPTNRNELVNIDIDNESNSSL